MFRSVLFSLALLLPLSAQAATVTFEDLTPPLTRYTVTSGGMDFSGAVDALNVIHAAPGGNGTNSLVVPLYVSFTLSLPGLAPFDLLAFDVAPAFGSGAFDLLVNGVSHHVAGPMRIEPGLFGVTSVRLQSLDFASTLSLDNVVYAVPATVPVPGAGALILTGLAGLAALSRRRRA